MAAPLILKPSPSSLFRTSCTIVMLLLVLAQFQASCLEMRNLKKHKERMMEEGQSIRSRGRCDLFVGRWIPDETYTQYYNSSGCPIIDPGFNCQRYGRPDSDYLKYRWKPQLCDLPRFDAVDFLMRMKGKRVMFVGDSLGRNQWESLICMISASVPRSPTKMFTQDPLSTFLFLEYGVWVCFHRAPYLVDIAVVDGKRILRLGEIGENGNVWKGQDLLSFNTGHWWSHTGALKGWDYVEWEGKLYQDVNRLGAFEYGLRTWAAWVTTNINTNATSVFFQSVSPTHYRPSASKSCYGETTPMGGVAYSEVYQGLMNVVHSVLMKMNPRPFLLDITGLSAMRKDAHPSIYGGGLNPDQRANPDHSDCSHWCLPGLPDIWNQLFYTALFFDF